jgi:hypothetical protein
VPASRFIRQKELPVAYKDLLLDCGYRLDFLVEGELVVEVKAVERLMPVHTAQVLTYLKLTGVPAGLLVNFHTDAINTAYAVSPCAREIPFPTSRLPAIRTGRRDEVLLHCARLGGTGGARAVRVDYWFSPSRYE